MKTPKRYYHFVGKTLRDGKPIPADGEWLEFKGLAKCCEAGLHASAHVADALKFAPGNTLCLVELENIADTQDDKVCAHRRKIVARFDATELLRADARATALSVAHLWKIPAIVRQYLETGNEAIREEARNAANAAADAAYAAAYADAAYANAANAAYAYAAAAAAHADAAYANAANAAYANTYANAADAKRKNRARLQKAVNAKFKELLK